MHVHRIILFSFFIFSVSFIPSTHAASRKSLKAMCKKEFKACVASGNSKKSCRKEKRQCRKENGVRFIDDIKNVGKKIGSAVKSVIGKVQVQRVEIGEEEIFLIDVESKHFARAPEIEIQPLAPKKSSVGIVADESGQKKLALQVYSSDFHDEHILEQLQTSPGRSFPNFLHGAKFDSLQGKEIGKVQVYLDSEVKVFGAFVPVKLAGGAINTANNVISAFLSKVPVLGDIIPEINSVPIGIKVKGIKVGRLSVLSNDDSGKNGGLVLLVDKEELQYAARL